MPTAEKNSLQMVSEIHSRDEDECENKCRN